MLDGDVQALERTVLYATTIAKNLHLESDAVEDWLARVPGSAGLPTPPGLELASVPACNRADEVNAGEPQPTDGTKSSLPRSSSAGHAEGDTLRRAGWSTIMVDHHGGRKIANKSDAGLQMLLPFKGHKRRCQLM